MGWKLGYDSNEHLDRDDRGTSFIRWRHMDEKRENWLRIHARDDSDFSEPLSPARLTRRTMSFETRDDRLKIISLDRIPVYRERGRVSKTRILSRDSTSSSSDVGEYVNGARFSGTSNRK